MTTPAIVPAARSILAEARADHIPLPNGNCDGCEQAASWPCDIVTVAAIGDQLADKIVVLAADEDLMIESGTALAATVRAVRDACDEIEAEDGGHVHRDVLDRIRAAATVLHTKDGA